MDPSCLESRHCNKKHGIRACMDGIDRRTVSENKHKLACIHGADDPALSPPTYATIPYIWRALPIRWSSGLSGVFRR